MKSKNLLILNLLFLIAPLILIGFFFLNMPNSIDRGKIEKAESNLTESQDIEFLRKSALSLSNLVLNNFQRTNTALYIISIYFLIILSGFFVNVVYFFKRVKDNLD